MPGVVISSEVQQVRGNGTPRGVDTRDEKKETGAQYMFVGKWITVRESLCLKLADQVVAWGAATSSNSCSEVLKYFLCRLGSAIPLVCVTLQNIYRPTSKHFAVLFRQTDH